MKERKMRRRKDRQSFSPFPHSSTEKVLRLNVVFVFLFADVRRVVVTSISRDSMDLASVVLLLTRFSGRFYSILTSLWRLSALVTHSISVGTGFFMTVLFSLWFHTISTFFIPMRTIFLFILLNFFTDLFVAALKYSSAGESGAWIFSFCRHLTTWAT